MSANHLQDPVNADAAPRGRTRRLLAVPAMAAIVAASACTATETNSTGADSGSAQGPGEALWGDLASPVGMAYDADGALYIANWSAGTIERFTEDGDRSTFASDLDGPSGLAIDAEGTVYAASYGGDVVWRFSGDGEPEVFVEGLATPAGLSFNAAGELLIANRQTDEILAADADGRTRVVATGLQTPVGAVELDNGDLMVSNINGGVSLVSGGTEAEHVNTELSSPGPGIAPAGGDAVYVVDYGGTTVDMIEPDGTRTTVADGFDSPTGIAVAPDGRLAVCDWGTGSVYLIDAVH
jgi:sugar lactone lactonase YvrE